MALPLLHSPQVRDLAWAVFSPPLLRFETQRAGEATVGNCDIPLTPARRRWLQTLDGSPAALMDFLAQRRSTRLGIYFEWLWRFFIESDPELELIAHNLPVREQGRTLGEFDILYRRRGEAQARHLELAVKYYLQYPPPALSPLPSLAGWLGPGAEDRLDLKVHRLLTHQIELSSTAAGEAAVRRLTSAPLIREIEVKGYLFQGTRPPEQIDNRLHQPPPGQRWLPISQLLTIDRPASPGGFQLLPRARWLGPARAKDRTLTGPQGSARESTDKSAVECAEPLTLSRLKERLTAQLEIHGRPQLAVALGDTGEERYRFFVVPQDWPTTSRPDRWSGSQS